MPSIVVSVHVHLPVGSPPELPNQIFALARDAGRSDFCSVGWMTIPDSSDVIEVLQFQLRGEGRSDFGKQLVVEIARLGFAGRLLVRTTTSGVTTTAWWPETPSWPTWEWPLERTRAWLQGGENGRAHPTPLDRVDLEVTEDAPAVHPEPLPHDASVWEWIEPRLGEFGTVGGLAPDGFDRCVLVDHTPPGQQGEYQAGPWLLEPLADVLAAATATPDAAWFAVWEGHGFDEDDRLALERLPCFELPGRRYHLLTGRVLDGAAMTLPASGSPWPPDLWWPDDRSWFVATDTDLSWSYVSGDEATITAVQELFPDRTLTMTREQWNSQANTGLTP